MCGGSETGAVTGDVSLALWQKIRGPRGGRLFGGPGHFWIMSENQRQEVRGGRRSAGGLELSKAPLKQLFIARPPRRPRARAHQSPGDPS